MFIKTLCHASIFHPKINQGFSMPCAMELHKAVIFVFVCIHNKTSFLIVFKNNYCDEAKWNSVSFLVRKVF